MYINYIKYIESDPLKSNILLNIIKYFTCF